jgi:uncharacterized membrane protein
MGSRLSPQISLFIMPLSSWTLSIRLQNQLDSARASHNRSKELLISVEKEIVTEIEINASPSRVWQILPDFEKYPTWNSFIKKISGEAARDEKLEVHMPDP